MKTKLALLLATLALLLAPSASAAKAEIEKKIKETHVTIQLKVVTAAMALNALSDLSGVPISLKNVSGKKRFSLNFEEATLHDAVEAVCRYHKLDWFVTDDGITVRALK